MIDHENLLKEMGELEIDPPAASVTSHWFAWLTTYRKTFKNSVIYIGIGCSRYESIYDLFLATKEDLWHTINEA